MKTLLKFVPTISPVVVVAVLMLTGCGPTRKQYAINEALLIDQTRLLENEIYKTRYQLQKALEENARLKEELGGPTKKVERRRLNEPRNERDQSEGNVPFDPPLIKSRSESSDTKKILVIPQSTYEQSLPKPEKTPVTKDVEQLPQAIVDSARKNTPQLMPVSKGAPVITRLPGPTAATHSGQYATAAPQRVLVVPENAPRKSETLPPAIVQPSPIKSPFPGTGTGTGIAPRSYQKKSTDKDKLSSAVYDAASRNSDDLQWSPVE